MIKAFPANVIQKSGGGKSIFIASGSSARPVTPVTDNAPSNSASRQPQVVVVGSAGELVFKFL